jgi:hypothetical protein
MRGKVTHHDHWLSTHSVRLANNRRMPQALGPAHWQERAREARVLAEQMSDEESRATMLEIARDYDKLAQRAEARQKPEPPPG